MQYKISAIVNNSNTARDCRLEKLHETGKSGGKKLIRLGPKIGLSCSSSSSH
jgi:hypothetical protein